MIIDSDGNARFNAHPKYSSYEVDTRTFTVQDLEDDQATAPAHAAS